MVAVIVIILLFALVFTRCTKNRDNNDANTDQTNNNETYYSETDLTDNNQSQFIDEGNENPVVVNPNTNENNTQDLEDVENTNEFDDTLNEALIANEEDLQTEYEDYADVTYSAEDNAYYFEFNPETTGLVENREDETDDFERFWTALKEDLITSSETIAETVEPGIELRIIDPEDDMATLMLIEES